MTSKPSNEKRSTDLPGANPSQSALPAFGRTDKELPDSLRPEVVDIEVVKRIGHTDAASPIDGSGISGNVHPDARAKHPQP